MLTVLLLAVVNAYSAPGRPQAQQLFQSSDAGFRSSIVVYFLFSLWIVLLYTVLVVVGNVPATHFCSSIHCKTKFGGVFV